MHESVGFPQTRWLKTMQIYCLTAMEPLSPKGVSWAKTQVSAGSSRREFVSLSFPASAHVLPRSPWPAILPL